jgi:membrane associated rhomboid family serine protease
MSYYQSGGPERYYRPSFRGGFRFFPPVIKFLLISNVAIWLLVDFFLLPFKLHGVPIGGAGGILTYYFALWPLGPNFWPWQLVTYLFMHGGFGHLFFNMLALWMFGMELENTWGSRKFATFYFLCGVGAGFTNLLAGPLLGQGLPTVGASGAIFGVLIAFGMMFPDRPIYVYFLLPVKAKYFITVFFLLELFYGVTGTTDGVAHFAHLGGAVVGFVYMLSEMGVLPFRAWWNQVRADIGRPSVSGDRVFRKPTGPGDVRDAKFYDIGTGRSTPRDDGVDQEVIDAILDKISKGGYQSLSEEEKRILNEASRNIH